MVPSIGVLFSMMLRFCSVFPTDGEIIHGQTLKILKSSEFVFCLIIQCCPHRLIWVLFSMMLCSYNMFPTDGHIMHVQKLRISVLPSIGPYGYYITACSSIAVCSPQMDICMYKHLEYNTNLLNLCSV